MEVSVVVGKLRETQGGEKGVMRRREDVVRMEEADDELARGRLSFNFRALIFGEDGVDMSGVRIIGTACDAGRAVACACSTAKGEI